MKKVIIVPHPFWPPIIANIGSEIKRIEAAGIDCLHVDIMDGHFVPQYYIWTRLCPDASTGQPNALWMST